MTVTRDVIYDLLPAYFAGQTRNLVGFEVEDQPRLGAELTGPEGERGRQLGGDRGASIALGGGADDDRVEARHLGEDGDWPRSCGGGVGEGPSGGLRAGEGDRGDLLGLGQRLPDLRARPVQGLEGRRRRDARPAACRVAPP